MCKRLKGKDNEVKKSFPKKERFIIKETKKEKEWNMKVGWLAFTAYKQV